MSQHFVASHGDLENVYCKWKAHHNLHRYKTYSNQPQIWPKKSRQLII